MTCAQERMFVTIHAAVLAREKDEEKCMELLEDFNRSAGLSITNWTERLKEELRKEEGGEAAIQTVDRYCAKNEVKDERGYVYFRRMFGNELNHVTITYDRNKPEGEQFTVEEYPNLDAMSVSELEAYLEDVESAMGELEDEDEDEDDRREESYDDLECLMSDIEDRISELRDADEDE